MADRAGLSGISITDHDTAEAYGDLEGNGPPGPRVLPGIEVSAAIDGVELHVLGYYPRGLPPGLSDLTRGLVAERMERIREGVAKLSGRGIEISWKDVLAEAKQGVVSRGHVAQILLRKRYVPNIYAAFPDLLGPEIVPPPEVDAREIVRELSRLGGITVLAHPSLESMERFLGGLREAGLEGVEILTPRRRSGERERLLREIRDLGLLVTGGSDWHGQDEEPLGKFWVTAAEVGGFLRAIGWWNGDALNPPRP